MWTLYRIQIFSCVNCNIQASPYVYHLSLMLKRCIYVCRTHVLCVIITIMTILDDPLLFCMALRQCTMEEYVPPTRNCDRNDKGGLALFLTTLVPCVHRCCYDGASGPQEFDVRDVLRIGRQLWRILCDHKRLMTRLQDREVLQTNRSDTIFQCLCGRMSSLFRTSTAHAIDCSVRTVILLGYFGTSFSIPLVDDTCHFTDEEILFYKLTSVFPHMKGKTSKVRQQYVVTL
jgi:hypothetical protein